MPTYKRPSIVEWIYVGQYLQQHRGFVIQDHALLNLFNELRQRDKLRGYVSILSLFRNEFNKFNKTKARMLDSIYHMTY